MKIVFISAAIVVLYILAIQRKITASDNCPLPPEACHDPATPKTTRKAFETREKADGDCLGKECYGIDGDFVRSERWKNAQKDIQYLPRTQDVVSIEISRTSDTGQLVVWIVDSDGRRAGFWATGKDGGDVRAITPY